MSKVYDFLKECGAFYVLTINEDFPAGRPFGAVMEIGEDLYIATSDTKPVYQQLKAHEKMQLLAMKPGTRDWMRVDGVATECPDVETKQKMLDACPNLGKHYASADAPHFNVFKISVVNSEFQ